MSQSPYEAYIEDRVLSAEPVELVHLLYQAASSAIRDARRHLAEGDIAARSRAISKACGIVLELATVLDHERGGEISRKLGQLYEYIHHRLLEANFQQKDEPLAEVLGLVATLSEAWEPLAVKAASPVPAANPWAQAPEPAMAGAGRAWSL